MNISEFKETLSKIEKVTFILPNAELIPSHFHVTELGVISKNYIDCGGTIREEKIANFQLWSANDFDHRIKPQKILDIIKIAESSLNLEDLEIEVEYQSDTIGKYGLDYRDGKFILCSTRTDCLSKDKCGIPLESTMEKDNTSYCDPSSGCC